MYARVSIACGEKVVIDMEGWDIIEQISMQCSLHT